MPELPEVQALVDHLGEHAVGHRVARADPAGMSTLKTFQPALSELAGREIVGVARHGKFLDLNCHGLHLVIHLSRAGWLRWHESASAASPKPGRGPLALRLHLDSPGGPGFNLTEVGSQKRLAVYLVADPAEVPGIARLGPDAFSVSCAELAGLLAGRTERIKNLITDQSVLAGIGNAYSDEILHAARLSPYAVAGRMGEAEVAALHGALRSVLVDAMARYTGGNNNPARLKGEKRSGMRVHARTGLPCPSCGDLIREVSFTDRSFQYCPTCQTGGKPLADRRLSRLVR